MTLSQTTTTNKVIKFRRKYSSTFSRVDWGSAATSVATRRKSDSDSSLSLESIDIPRNETKQQELVERCVEMLGDTLAPLNYGISKVIIYSVPTKGIAATPPLRNDAKVIDTSTSYLTLKDEYQKRRSDHETPHREKLQYMTRSISDKTERGSSPSSFHVETITVPTRDQSTQQQQQQRRHVGKSKSSNESPMQRWIRVKKTSRGTKHIFPSRNSINDLAELYAPSKQRKQPPRLLVSFNSGRGENGDGRGSVKEKMSLSCWCQVMIILALFVVGLVTCIVFVVDIDSMKEMNGLSNNGDQSLLEDFSAAHQQHLLELAEQITAACQGSSKLRSSSRFTCQSLCNDHLCSFEEDEEYSCKDDFKKDCGVYAGCMALIDESWI